MRILALKHALNLWQLYVLVCAISLFAYFVQPQWVLTECSGYFISSCLGFVGKVLAVASLPGILLTLPIVFFVKIFGAQLDPQLASLVPAGAVVVSFLVYWWVGKELRTAMT